MRVLIIKSVFSLVKHRQNHIIFLLQFINHVYIWSIIKEHNITWFFFPARSLQQIMIAIYHNETMLFSCEKQISYTRATPNLVHMISRAPTI